MANQELEFSSSQSMKWNIHLESGRKKRKNLSKKNLSLLVSQFEKNPKPNKQVRRELSQIIPGMTERSIQVWFQNRRTKMNLTKKRSISISGSSSQENIYEEFSSCNTDSENEEADSDNESVENQKISLEKEKKASNYEIENEGRAQKQRRTLTLDTSNNYENNLNVNLEKLDLSRVQLSSPTSTPSTATTSSSYLSSPATQEEVFVETKKNQLKPKRYRRETNFPNFKRVATILSD